MPRTTVNDLIAKARENIDNLSLSEAQDVIAEEGTLLVDIRDPRERWRDGTIPGAKNVTRGMLEFWADPESEYYKDYFVATEDLFVKPRQYEFLNRVGPPYYVVKEL